MPDGYTMATRRTAPLAEPFATAECAWIWCAQTLLARREGARQMLGMTAARPCTPDDILCVLNRLYNQRRILLEHARVLRVFGDRGIPPDAKALPEMEAAALWKEAMDRLTWPLQAKGIVSGAEDRKFLLQSVGR